MIRLVCPFCHAPLSATELETATLGERVCLVCPECQHILLVDEPQPTAPVAAPADA